LHGPAGIAELTADRRIRLQLERSRIVAIGREFAEGETRV